MTRAQSYDIRICEECGQPIDRGRGHQFLCRRCEEGMERQKRKGERTRQSRRNSRRSKGEDW